MPDPTGADRQRRWRERRKAGASYQPLICAACSRNHTGAHGVLCNRCWQSLTSEGRADRAARVAKARARRRSA